MVENPATLSPLAPSLLLFSPHCDPETPSSHTDSQHKLIPLITLASLSSCHLQNTPVYPVPKTWLYLPSIFLLVPGSLLTNGLDFAQRLTICLPSLKFLHVWLKIPYRVFHIYSFPTTVCPCTLETSGISVICHSDVYLKIIEKSLLVKCQMKSQDLSRCTHSHIPNAIITRESGHYFSPDRGTKIIANPELISSIIQVIIWIDSHIFE